MNINLHGTASLQKQVNSNSLQWFPSLAADNDTVYVAWADERNGNYTRIMNNQPHKSGDIYLSKGNFQDGWVFDEDVRINEIKGTTGHGSPSIAVDNDNFYVVWEDDRFGFEELYFTSSPKNNIKFSKDSQVAQGQTSRVLPSISVLNRTVYVAMMNKNNWDIEFAEGYPVNGIYRFDEPVRVNDDPAGNWHYAPSIAVDDEKNVCIAWLDARNSNYDIYFSHGIKDNGIWRFSKNIVINDDSANASQYTPSVAFENGTVYVTWYDDRDKNFDIYISAGKLENDKWKFRKNIRVNDEADGDQMHPAVAAGDGGIFIAWEDGRDGGPDIYFSKGIMKDVAPEFGKNVKVNDIKGKHYDPQIALSGAGVYVVWQAENIPYNDLASKYGEYGTDRGDIYFSQGKYNNGTWEFGENIKVNDDLIYSFAEPDIVFLGSVTGVVVLSIMLVGFLKRKNEKRK
ncbi:MAG: hypothetical protein FIB08_12615 [Candidatus Methanoperedens sp.]|nr:hypothetical protein [Candidatus Methanoperedens sp.]